MKTKPNRPSRTQISARWRANSIFAAALLPWLTVGGSAMAGEKGAIEKRMAELSIGKR
jgi:hypothetical protein